MTRHQKPQFTFRRHDRIGAEDAEQDLEYLRSGFVDTGDLTVLRDTKDPRRIVIGRTGAGKTALLLMLSTVEERVARVDPDQLALNYLANSTILRHLDTLGVNLDLFYRLLWRHIFAVELVQLRYALKTEADQKGFLERMVGLFKGDRRKEEALQYLVDWGSQFWKDTEYRIHQVAETFERDVKASLGDRIGLLNAHFGGGAKLSHTDQKEIVHRAQEVVNHVQVQRLSKVVDILASDILDDPQQHYYVLIDRLDESWVPDPLRYRLIRALVETVKDLQRIGNAKIVVALRRDLLQRVFRETRDSGFQEEKYQALYLPIQWTKRDLLSVLEKRLQHLIKANYSGHPVTWQNIFPSQINKVDTGDYLVERTQYRPRDIIQFCNCSIALATDRPAVTAQHIRNAETQYSLLRFRSLGDEWAADYPDLLDVANLLKKRPPIFQITDIGQGQLDVYCIQDVEAAHPGRLAQAFRDYFNGVLSVAQIQAIVVSIFYDVGLVGLKMGTSAPVSWSFLERDVLRSADITTDTRVVVCPMFYRVLGIGVHES